MKIVNISGGLGNQMFQYAFALSLKNRFPHEDVLIDTSHYGHLFFKKYKGANLHNGFEIHKVFPNASLKIARPKQLMSLSRYIPNYVLSRVARKFLPKKESEIIQKTQDYFAHKPEYYEVIRDAYYEGIWESATNYVSIRSQLQSVFSHGSPNDVNNAYIKEIYGSNSVGIHIRRGDYLHVPEFGGICDLEYYKAGIDLILSDGEDPRFYIFSNDPVWCEENIVPLCKGCMVKIVSENKGENSCWDMFLMTYCRDLIIANSSFSWWGAFLNKREGKVIAPAKWVNRDAEFDIWLDNWIKIRKD